MSSAYRLFGDLFRDSKFDLAPFSVFEGPRVAWVPRVDVAQNDKGLIVSAELPGLDERDIEVSVSDNVLTLKGEKKVEKEDKGKQYYRIERSYGEFIRSIELPAGIDQDKIEATFKKGVLTITLPKAANAQDYTRKIAVTSE